MNVSESEPEPAVRNLHLDVLRSVAILVVMLFHILKNFTDMPAGVHAFAELGKFGVDLFFVLSGWLIGGIYWQERKQFGNVQLLRFWQRRWLRTLPLYFIVLPISYIAVYISRKQAFDPAYLIFAQNYRETMPFFSISWSLCVEEHFYLILPLILPLILSARKPGIWLIVLLIGALLSRHVDPTVQLVDASVQAEFARLGVFPPFGYNVSATHLRLEGLLFGVWFSYCAAFAPLWWQNIIRLSKILLLPALVLFFALPWASDYWQFYFGATIASVLSAAWLAAGIQGKYCEKWPVAVRISMQKIALWSFGIYMTHGLVLNGFTKIIFPYLSAADIWFEWTFFPSILVMLIVGALCYRWVEQPTMRFRDRYFPRRSAPTN